MGGCRCLLALCIALLGSPLILCSSSSTATAEAVGPGANGGAGAGAGGTTNGALDDFNLFKSNRFQSLVRTAVAAAEANQALLVAGGRTGTGPLRCRSTEFHCENTNHCIPLSKYCDRKIDCPDKSDEPASCTVCNRTLYGEINKTYEIEVPKPGDVPFVCTLNFTALGDEHGDIIQLNFNKFNVGRFTSFKDNGCLDGAMSIHEEGLAHTDGQWCGTQYGFSSYYSETGSILVTLRVHKLVQGLGNNFEFKLSYKFLRKSDALLRNNYNFYNAIPAAASSSSAAAAVSSAAAAPTATKGGSNIWLGEATQSSYCNRVLSGCDKRHCIIRSPNYPGIYPRNMTCVYRITQEKVPTGLHAMIALQQNNRHKLHIKDQGPQSEQNVKMLRSWEECDQVQDYISVFDGKSETAPEIARFCGGDVLPEIVSSGTDMLVVFKTSAFDSLYHNYPLPNLLGYELQVSVKYVNSNSFTFVHARDSVVSTGGGIAAAAAAAASAAEGSKCEFVINSFENQFGELESPHHTLPPNTLCRYHFQGRRHETVWISFLKYNSGADSSGLLYEAQNECQAQLRIWDGKVTNPHFSNIGSSLDFTPNSSLLAEVCREDVPKLCSRPLISKRARPCNSEESYLSTGSDLTMEYRPNPNGPMRLYGPNSAFRLRYEFVDTSLGGTPLDPVLLQTRPGHRIGGHVPEPAALVQSHSTSCNRVYKSTLTSRGVFRSPSNVFFYGRGGSENISCTIRFEARLGESVRLTITRARFGGRTCENIQNRSGRWHCNHQLEPKSDLRIGELPWPEIGALPRDCLCSDITRPLTLAPLASNIVEVTFQTHQMNVDQDFRDFYFEGRYEFATDGCSTDWDSRRLKGKSGNTSLSASDCAPLIQPWLLEPESPHTYLALKLKGFFMPTVMHSLPPCPTDARITVYSTNFPSEQRDLCPGGTSDVVTFSDGWDNVFAFTPKELSRSLVVEYRSPWKSGIDNLEYKFAWMEVMPLQPDCRYKCDELRACIAPELWCDGIKDCLMGQDESDCDVQLPLSPLYVGIAAATITLVLSCAAGLAACMKRKRIEEGKHYDSQSEYSDGATHYPPHYHNVNQHHHQQMIYQQQTIGHHNEQQLQPPQIYHPSSSSSVAGGVGGGGAVVVGTSHKHHNHRQNHIPASMQPMFMDSQGKDSFC